MQGITVRPGDPVILELPDGRTVPRIFSGVCKITGRAFLLMDTLTTDPDRHFGPWDTSMLRHPDILTGIVNEIAETDQETGPCE